MKTNRKKAALIAFLVSLVLLVMVVTATLMFDYYNESIQFDTTGMIIGDILGFLLIFFIVYKFETKPDSFQQENRDHNIY